ncbi:metallophosphoesterase [Pochonia chlamydosporia 170]|uniref:Purple acid phosphatase n=1 Tax=Pochonia chlamydosporia 170 TaxID=1380566 RepID=A0A179G1Y6_METCM|nr:metallophosphoesterase [Pochonia chlamydosporia 170]OAQ71361.1 metallophosphoesterase [Pochonia chlamydosporia 170]
MRVSFVLVAALRGATALLSPRGADAAGQIRLAYHGTNGMTVSWNTFEHVKAPSVKWGLSKNKLVHTASSNVSVTYPTSTTYNSHVLISGLKSDTTYYYLPSPLPQGDGVKPYSFTTARSAGDTDAFSVAVVVDLGTMGRLGLTTSAGKGVSKSNILKPGEKNTIDSLATTRPTYDFIWHPGDIAYADYWLKEEIQGFLPNTSIKDGHNVYETILNDFYDEMAAVTETKPYMVGPGNHEANCDNGGTTDKSKNITYDVSICSPGQTNFTGYKNHFRMPSDVSGGTGNFWYSWENGMVHFIQLDTETDLGHGYTGPDEIGGTEKEGASPVNATMNAQATWLEDDLASVDRKKTPWVVVAGHRPWYLSKKNVTGTICWSCKDVFEPLFLKYNVDLVLTGHAHVYERLSPLATGKIDPNELNNPKAPWYITNGAAGHYDGLDTFDEPKQKYSRFGLDANNATYGWSRLTFHNCSHLTHEFVASNNNSVLDTATLYKARACRPGGGDGNGNGTTHHNGTATGTASRTPTGPTVVPTGGSGTGPATGSATGSATSPPLHTPSTADASAVGSVSVLTLLGLMVGVWRM